MNEWNITFLNSTCYLTIIFIMHSNKLHDLIWFARKVVIPETKKKKQLLYNLLQLVNSKNFVSIMC